MANQGRMQAVADEITFEYPISIGAFADSIEEHFDADKVLRIVCEDVGGKADEHPAFIVGADLLAGIDFTSHYKPSREERWTWSSSDFYLQPEDRSDAWTVSVEVVFPKDEARRKFLKPWTAGSLVQRMHACLDEVDEEFRDTAWLNDFTWRYFKYREGFFERLFKGPAAWCSVFPIDRKKLAITLAQPDTLIVKAAYNVAAYNVGELTVDQGGQAGNFG